MEGQQYACTTDGCKVNGLVSTLHPISLAPFAAQKLDPICTECHEPLERR